MCPTATRTLSSSIRSRSRTNRWSTRRPRRRSAARSRSPGRSAAGGRQTFDAANDGIGVSAFYDAESKLAADTQAKVDEALAAMKAGTLVTCPADTCGSQDALADLGD